MLRDKPYAHRVFDNNFRGDFVAGAKKKGRGSRRDTQTAVDASQEKLLELTDAKVSVNPVFIMRLEADKVNVSFYEQEAIKRNLPLTCGIGSPQIDRNSIEDIDATRISIREDARSFVASIKRVCENVDLPQDNHVGVPWPSHVYFEDINGQSHFELVEIILDEVYKAGPINRPKSSRAD